LKQVIAAYTNYIVQDVSFCTSKGDMIMDVPILVDLAVLRVKRQGLVDEAARRENAKRFDFNYTVGQEVYVKEHNPDKLQPRAIGPFPITQVFTNGTVEIQAKPHVVKLFNIR
jgi:hypothetical protein